MPKFDSVTPGVGLRIRKKGNFPLNKLYISIKDWLNEYEYSIFEKENSIKGKQRGTEVKIKIEASREIDSYAQFSIKINFLGENINKTGNNNEGLIEIRVYGDLILDYDKNWQSSQFKEFLYKIYNNFIIISKIKSHYLENLENEVNDLHNLIKDTLGLNNE